YYLQPRVCSSVFFFFQAEDGIRDATVTGVQTCALPISRDHLEPDRTAVSEPEDDWVRNYFNYFTEVEEHFQRARGTSLFLMSPLDRKSTRLNSSHGSISYAVFCLKKKNNT